MRSPGERLAIATELLESGLLCKCPHGPTVEIEHPTMAGWYTKKTVIEHTPECEGRKNVFKIIDGD